MGQLFLFTYLAVGFIMLSAAGLSASQGYVGFALIVAPIALVWLTGTIVFRSHLLGIVI